MEVKKDIQKILKDGLRKSFGNGYKAKNRDEALNNLSESLGNDIINYLDNYSSSGSSTIDLLARQSLKDLIDEVEKIRIDIGVSLNKEKVKEIKNRL